MEPNRRFIPAYAGNSRFQENLASMFTVHPRLRGELPAPIAAVAVMDGSSPLTRGTRSVRVGAVQVIRFIPAYAGNSLKESGTQLLEPVHPRLRGELEFRENMVDLERGSSPLTRGTHLKTV